MRNAGLNGRVTFVSEPATGAKDLRLLRVLATDGAIPPEGYLGPVLPGQIDSRSPAHLAASPDGKVLYVSGLLRGKETMDAVFRAAWSDKEVTEFVPKSAGLKDPRGLATDPQGRLYVCDFDNDQVRVFSPDGKELKKWAVTGPEQIAVHPATGAVYVLSVRDTTRGTRPKWAEYREKALVKYAGIEAGKPQAEIPLPNRNRAIHDVGPLLALDYANSPPAILISSVGRPDAAGDYLWKILDRGTVLERVDPPIPPAYWPYGLGEGRPAIAADRDRDELYMSGRSFPGFLRCNGQTGQITELRAITDDIAFMMPRSFGRPWAQASGLTVGRRATSTFASWVRAAASTTGSGATTAAAPGSRSARPSPPTAPSMTTPACRSFRRSRGRRPGSRGSTSVRSSWSPIPRGRITRPSRG
jgi:DNA-binding beta-propeller fold protein YncE